MVVRVGSALQQRRKSPNGKGFAKTEVGGWALTDLCLQMLLQARVLRQYISEQSVSALALNYDFSLITLSEPAPANASFLDVAAGTVSPWGLFDMWILICRSVSQWGFGKPAACWISRALAAQDNCSVGCSIP